MTNGKGWMFFLQWTVQTSNNIISINPLLKVTNAHDHCFLLFKWNMFVVVELYSDNIEQISDDYNCYDIYYNINTFTLMWYILEVHAGYLKYNAFADYNCNLTNATINNKFENDLRFEYKKINIIYFCIYSHCTALFHLRERTVYRLDRSLWTSCWLMWVQSGIRLSGVYRR